MKLHQSMARFPLKSMSCFLIPNSFFGSNQKAGARFFQIVIFHTKKIFCMILLRRMREGRQNSGQTCMNGTYLVLLIVAFTFVCNSIHYAISRTWYGSERAGAFVLTWVFCLLFLPKKKSKSQSDSRTLPYNKLVL
jgi:hypothetical protein